MNWLNKLLRAPAAPSSASKPPMAPRRRSAPAPGPVADIAALRGALAAAADDEERGRRAGELGRALADAKKAPLPEDGPAVLAAAVCHATDKALALAWAARLQGDAWLGGIALSARFAEVRLAAAQRIQDGAVLEQVARQSRDKDKGVYRHCSESLRARRLAGERAQRARQLAAELRTLLATSPVSVSRLLELEHELDPLGDGIDSIAECKLLVEQATARIRQDSQERRKLQAIQAAIASLSAQVSGTACPDADALASWRDRLGALRQDQAGLAPWLAAEPTAHALSASLAEVESRLAALAADNARSQACAQFLDAFERGSPAAAPLDAGAVAAWEALAKPEHPAARQRLQERWQGLQTPAASPPRPAPPVLQESPPAAARSERALATPPKRVDLDAVHSLLESLESALDQGQLAEADAGAKQIKAAIGANRVGGSIDSRLQRAQARLAELRGWAQWGASKKREDLIAAAAQLIIGNHGIDHLAVAVPALREEWKRLQTQGPPTKAQWESFDATLEKAFQPVAAQRAQEAALRSQARAGKEALLKAWEAAVAGVDWERPDSLAISLRRQQMLEQWRAAPHAAYRDERALRKRLDALIECIDQRVDAARSAEVQRREQLIAEAEALREIQDLRQATAEAKALQERWRNEAGAPQLPRGSEQKLWKRFRSACDAVFARRDALRSQELAQREQKTQARAALLDAFAATLTSSDANEVKRALAQFRLDWDASKDAAKGSAGESSDAQERRMRELQQQAQRRVDALRQEGYRTRLEQLAQKAAPVDGLDVDVLAAGREARESLLIDIEIALGLPSPDASAEARRRRQLEQLQSRFRGGAEQRPDAEQMLAQLYAVPAARDEALDQRVAAVVRKLVAKKPAAH